MTTEWLDTRSARGLVIAVSAGVLIAVAASFDRVDPPRADEGYYIGYATRIAQGGVGELPVLAREYIEEPRHHRFPNPLRAAYLSLVGGWTALRGPGPQPLREIAWASHALTIALGFAFARRAFGPTLAAATGVLLACSPLLLGLSRRALSDNTATAAAIAVFFASYLWAKSPDALRRGAALAAAVAAALLVKESSALLLLPCAAYAALVAPPGERMRRVFGFGLVAGGGVVLAFGVWILAMGGVEPFLRIVQIILDSPATNPYAQQFGGGPIYRYLVDFLLLSPATTTVALLFAVPLVQRRFAGDRDAWLLLGVTVIGLVLAHDLFTKNVRYVAGLELPIRAFAAWALVHGSATLAPERPLRGLAVGLLALCALDLWSFYGIFVVDGLYDPVTAELARVWGFAAPW